ncbi:MAG: NAD(+)/NADH kinase [Chloroflexi bacterium]|nr:NAD(+)/NADH kinase [Chloroflexota bacterium]
MTLVGIIANPAAGKDIRRLVAHGRVVPNQEKVNILRRIFAGLDAVGVRNIVMMPDVARLGNSALDGTKFDLQVEFLDMIIYNAERDSTTAAKMMEAAGVGCIVTLGGDGTNRVVAKGIEDVPLVPVSTGTNNVFPAMVEGTLAGLAAGLVALGLVDARKTTVRSKRLEVYVDDEYRDMALVDVAVSMERFVGARALWDIDTIHELFLSRAEPSSIGLSAIGGQLRPVGITEKVGLHLELGPGGPSVTAPIAPGVVIQVDVKRWAELKVGERVSVGLRRGTIALDGERTFSLRGNEKVEVCLSSQGPRVVDIDAALTEASLGGVLVREASGSDGV